MSGASLWFLLEGVMPDKIHSVRFTNISRGKENLTASIDIDLLAKDGVSVGRGVTLKVPVQFAQSDTLEEIEKKSLEQCSLLLKDISAFSTVELYHSYLNPVDHQGEIDLSGLDILTTQ
jgi:hypothetical protein